MTTPATIRRHDAAIPTLRQRGNTVRSAPSVVPEPVLGATSSGGSDGSAPSRASSASTAARRGEDGAVLVGPVARLVLERRVVEGPAQEPARVLQVPPLVLAPVLALVMAR